MNRGAFRWGRVALYKEDGIFTTRSALLYTQGSSRIRAKIPRMGRNYIQDKKRVCNASTSFDHNSGVNVEALCQELA